MGDATPGVTAARRGDYLLRRHIAPSIILTKYARTEFAHCIRVTEQRLADYFPMNKVKAVDDYISLHSALSVYP